MRQRKFLSVLPVLLIASVVFAAIPSGASVMSDALTVLDKNGNIVQQITVTEAQEDPNGTSIFTLPGGFANTSMFGKALVLCESLPCDANSPVSNFSDIVGIVANNGTPNFLFGFSSDGEKGTSFGSQGAIFVLEVPGFAYDVTQYLDVFRVKAGQTAWFISDGDASPVPESGTLALLGIGFLGLAGVARRKLS